MADYLIRKHALDGASLERLKQGLLSSPLLGKSTLAGSFRNSYGFAITFTEPGRIELLARYPELEPALAALVAPPELTRRAPNAWYLNLLQLPAGQGVGRHTDGTLRRPADEPELLPLCVSVLYLEAPSGSGALELFRGAQRIATLEPESGAVVHFEGALEHAVGAGPAARVSLVLEQYALAAEALARLPAFKLDSRAGFAAYLADHGKRPPRKLDLE